MNKYILFLVVLTLVFCKHHHHEEKHEHEFKRKFHEHHPHFEFKKHHEFKKFDHKKFWKKFHHEDLETPKVDLAERRKEIAHKVNKLRTTWTAVEYVKDYTPLLGSLEGGDKLPEREFNKLGDLPENFDLREAYPNCESIKEIRDQANCGSCWAFGAAEAMSDRLCIKSGQTDQRRVSTQNLLACCYSCGFGCDGGYPSSAWNYWKSTGLVTGGLYGDKKTCQPYFLPPCDHHTHGSHGDCPESVETPDCKKTCDEGTGIDYSSDLIYGASAYSVSGEEKIMQDIYENGSVEASFTVYEDFLNYKSGIYQYVEGSSLGGHAIKMIGWGVENGVKYWICVNSWNEEWGEAGIFRILRGENECGIERSVNAGLPK